MKEPFSLAPCPVYETLAWEDAILDVEPDQGRFYFAVHPPAIVVGKNQNPWREADVIRARREGVAVARRVTGGGTVYHDEGNLNYGVWLPRGEYRMDTVFGWVLDALRALGIDGERGEGHGLFVAGRKFSGTAFCYRGPSVLHHGTLLVRSDLARLRALCRACVTGIETRAIASRPAHVMNLSDERPGLAVQEVEAALADVFQRHALARIAVGDPPGDIDRFRSWDWTYGHTPVFTVSGRDGEPVEVMHGRVEGLPFDAEEMQR